ncbi:ABC transporter ATP-binding protein [Propionibacterium cyclohexanicum]|uniref:ABC transporter ATP-binding protein n=1 Tax=Propionibacterium cyclohexanicum TaxID=64702 RepID=UPI000B13E6AC|nr:ABC transporter ATP-binding protein [Propionibacterium cyclohexanicum]
MVQGIAVAPRAMVLALLISIIAAFFPALQVLILNQIPEVQDTPTRLLSLIIFLGIASGCVFAAQEIANTLQATAKWKVITAMRDRLDQTLANVPLKLVGDRKSASSAGEAREAVEHAIAPLAVVSIRVIMTAVMVVSLCGSLWKLSWLAALFVFFSLAPSVAGNWKLSRLQDRLWPPSIEHSKRAEYFENQLIYQRSAVELAGLQTRTMFADRASRERKEWLSNHLKFARTSLSCDTLSGVVGSASSSAHCSPCTGPAHPLAVLPVGRWGFFPQHLRCPTLGSPSVPSWWRSRQCTHSGNTSRKFRSRQHMFPFAHHLMNLTFGM